VTGKRWRNTTSPLYVHFMHFMQGVHKKFVIYIPHFTEFNSIKRRMGYEI
jgi:hypothetical protein